MNDKGFIQTGMKGFIVEIEKKKIKNMYLKVLPPDGRVHITAPYRMPEETIYAFIQSKTDWIKRQQDKLRQRLDSPEAVLEYRTGEEVMLWGKKLPLEVIYSEKRNWVEQEEGRLLLHVREAEEESTILNRRKLLYSFYRDTLSRELPHLFDQWQKRIGVRAGSWYIRDMKTRWGTCNIRSKRICMNMKLVQKAPECLEYVVVHELVHLLEKSHNRIFKAYMDQFYPGWRAVKARLNGRD